MFPLEKKGKKGTLAGTVREEKIAWKQPGKQSVSEKRLQPLEAKAGSRQDTKWDRKGEYDEAGGSQCRREGPRQVGKVTPSKARSKDTPGKQRSRRRGADAGSLHAR